MSDPFTSAEIAMTIAAYATKHATRTEVYDALVRLGYANHVASTILDDVDSKLAQPFAEIEGRHIGPRDITDFENAGLEPKGMF